MIYRLWLSFFGWVALSVFAAKFLAISFENDRLKADLAKKEPLQEFCIAALDQCNSLNEARKK